MSRVAKKPIAIPSGVEVNVTGNVVAIKGAKGQQKFEFSQLVSVGRDADNHLVFAARDGSKTGWAMAGTARAQVANIITGVTKGFEQKLQLIGVGYRAQAQGKVLNLTLGFSHPVNFSVPEGIQIETPSQTEIVIKGINKQQVGEVAAKIRSYRPPEPYKGKGVRYADEVVILKEAKKK